jgi:hypothetical protein
MAAELDVAIKALLTEALPGLFGGATPAVKLDVVSDAFVIDKRSTEPIAGQPRPDDRVDSLAFDPDDPAGPYVLTASPYPGPRRVRLRSATGAVTTLTAAELAWDPHDSRRLTVQPRPGRDLSGFTALEVLYGVTAVFTSVKGTRTLELAFEGADAGELRSAEALALAAIALNRERLVADAVIEYSDGDYRARESVISLGLTQARGLTDQTRGLTLVAEVGYKLERALREDEGTPIEHILSPGRTPDPARAVDIGIDVDA